MKKLLLAAAMVAGAMSMSAQEVDIYLVGSNINGGKSWECGLPEGKMTYVGEGIYEWDGEVLGTGFKLNDGTWSNPTYNLGTSDICVLGEELFLVESGGDIGFGDDFSRVENAHVIFNDNNKSIIVTGTPAGKPSWYITGDFCDYTLGDDQEMTEVGEKVYEKKDLQLDNVGYFKVSTTGWAKKYGSYDEELVFGFDIFDHELEEVFGDTGNVAYYMTGTFDVRWDLNNQYITFSEPGENFVEAVEAAENEAQYFNLQGVRVANPEKGLFISVKNGKATKVVIR